MGEGTRREREGAGRAPERDTRVGAEKVFSPPPPGSQRGRRLVESGVRAWRGESMTRPVGTATWVGAVGRGGAAERRCHGWAPSGLGEWGRQCSGPFWRLGRIGRSCGARARLADRHFTSCGGGGGSRGDGFLQGKKTRPRGEGGEAQISCRRGLAGGRAGGGTGGAGRGRCRPFSGIAAAPRVARGRCEGRGRASAGSGL